MSDARRAAPEQLSRSRPTPSLQRRPRSASVERAVDPERFECCTRRISRSLSVGLFVVFYWFSIQKFAHDVSPAEDVAGQTVAVLTGHLLPVRTGLLMLASWELLLGAALLFFPRSRLVLWTTFLHMSLTFATFAVFPDLTLGATAGSLTLLGQYIVKNLVLLGGLYTLIELERLQRNAPAAGFVDDPGAFWAWDDDRRGDQVFEDAVFEDEVWNDRELEGEWAVSGR